MAANGLGEFAADEYSGNFALDADRSQEGDVWRGRAIAIPAGWAGFSVPAGGGYCGPEPAHRIDGATLCVVWRTRLYRLGRLANEARPLRGNEDRRAASYCLLLR